nr:MAG TPA: hypothetical protein [Bacteriophage sp.]
MPSKCTYLSPFVDFANKNRQVRPLLSHTMITMTKNFQQSH